MKRGDSALCLALLVTAVAMSTASQACYRKAELAAQSQGRGVDREFATIAVGGATIEIQFAPGHLDLPRRELVRLGLRGRACSDLLLRALPGSHCAYPDR